MKISAPASLSRRFVAPAICDFARLFPDIDVQVDVTDRVVNLQEEGYDVAIRCGVLTDSALIAKRLASDRLIVVASPAYIEEHGMPMSPADLPVHKCLILGDGSSWGFDRESEPHNIRVNARLRSDNGELLRHAALKGLGLLRTSEILAGDDLREGRLVRVFEKYELTADAAIWAVYPGPKHVLPKLRVFLDFLAEWFRMAQQRPGESDPAVAGEPQQRSPAAPKFVG